MPRIGRIKSETAVYHIMMRGNNRHKIFCSAEEKNKMTEIIYEKVEIDKVILYAYCIMDNHLHMIIGEGNALISQTMKRIGTSYALYYNKKHGKIGHVFQDRYKSEAIENEKRLLAAVRYVHRNPVKAGISDLHSYKWSSYKRYLDLRLTCTPGIKEILQISSNNPHQAIKAFIDFHEDIMEENFIDVKDLSPEEAKIMAASYLKMNGISMSKLKNRENRSLLEDLVRKLAKQSDLSLREIATMLKQNRETVRRIISKDPYF